MSMFKGPVPLVLLIVLAAFAPFLSAGTIRHDLDQQLYLDLAGQPEYASVGRFDFFTTPSDFYMGSGTLIASDWVLTAGHVVDSAISLTFTIAGKTYEAASWLAYPKWRGDLLSGYDIGLVQLDSEVSGITPATLYTGSDELGAEAVAVGFGMTGTGETGAVISDGQKRAGQNDIDVLYTKNPKRKNPRILLSDFDNPEDRDDNVYGSWIPADLEYLIAPGDSGGGLFIDFADDGLGALLVGVHSFGASFDGETDSDYGDISGHTRVSEFGKWIDSVLSGSGNGDGKDNGKGWGKGGKKGNSQMVPEPATATLLMVGAVWFVRRRRFDRAHHGRRK